MDTFEKLPPHSIEAEEAVLGSLLIDPDAIFEVAAFLKAEAFYREQNKWVYEAILNLYERREPIDLITLAERLAKDDKLNEIGGEGYLIGLINTVPTAINAPSYGRLVEAAALRRKMIKAAGTIAKLAYDENEDIEIVIDRAEQTLFAVTEERTTRDLVPIKDIAQQYSARLKALAQQTGELIGIPTGFTDLDRILNGLNKSDLIILAARPGMGKTSLQMGVALTAGLRHKKRVAIFSMEMSAEQLVQRMVASETRIDSQRLRRGELHKQENSIFDKVIEELSKTSIFIDDTPGLSPTQLRTKCRRLYAERGLDLILIDYLQLMQSDRINNNRVQEISDISRGLKNLARELNVPVLAAAQLSRAVEQRQDKRPVLSDLRDSGSIEQDADIVMFIYRDEYYNPDTTERPHIAEINIAKHRNGPTATVDLFWHGTLATFRNLQKQELNL